MINICDLNGNEYLINKNIIFNYLNTWSNTGWTYEDKIKIVDNVCSRIDSIDIDINIIQEFNFVEDAYTDGAVVYIFEHNNSIQSLLEEDDDNEIFKCIGHGKPKSEDLE